MKNATGLYSVKAKFDDIERAATELSSNNISDSERRTNLSNIYKDSLIQQAVEVPVRDALSSWRLPADKELLSLDNEVGIKSALIDAGIHARIYGQSMLIPVIVDQNNNRVPLTTTIERLKINAERYRVVRVILIKNFSASDFTEENVLSDNFGRPKYYTVNGNRVNASRCIVIKANNAGTSFIEAIMPYYCNFKRRDHETTRAVEEANFLAFGTDLNMLIEIANAQVEAQGGNAELIVEQLIRERLRELRRNANNSGVWGYDKESEKVEQVSKTNIAAMVAATDQSAKFLSAAVDIPASRFWDFRPSGMAGDGGDGKNYNQTLVGLRSFMFEPALYRLDKILQIFTPSIKSTDYEWNELPILN
jgi:hypothetical protein